MRTTVKYVGYAFAVYVLSFVTGLNAVGQTGPPTAQTQKSQANPPANTEPDIPKVELPSSQPVSPGNQAATENAQAAPNAWSDLAIGLRKIKEGVLAGLLVAGICAY